MIDWILRQVEKFRVGVFDVVNSYEEYAQWPLQQGVTAKKIVDFGCNTGSETLALLHFFDAEKVVGVDKPGQDSDGFEILPGGSWGHFQSVAKDFLHVVHYIDQVPPDIRHQLPLGEMMQMAEKITNRDISFVQGDMTATIGLDESSFDLAYCERVLCHIDADGMDNLRTAIAEMVKVIKPGSYIAAIEPLGYLNHEDDIKVAFEAQGNLTPLVTEHLEELSGNKRGYYLYKRHI